MYQKEFHRCFFFACNGIDQYEVHTIRVSQHCSERRHWRTRMISIEPSYLCCSHRTKRTELIARGQTENLNQHSC
jgi:hypothetical protein